MTRNPPWRDQAANQPIRAQDNAWQNWQPSQRHEDNGRYRGNSRKHDPGWNYSERRPRSVHPPSRLCEIVNRWNSKDGLLQCRRSQLDDPQLARNPPVRLVDADRPRSSDVDTDMQDLPWRKDEPQERSNEARVGDLTRSLESRKGREKSGEPLETIDLEEDVEARDFVPHAKETQPHGIKHSSYVCAGRETC